MPCLASLQLPHRRYFFSDYIPKTHLRKSTTYRQNHSKFAATPPRMSISSNAYPLDRLASEQTKPVNGLSKLLEWIEDSGLKRAAVTNAPRSNAELLISRLGLSDFFKIIVIGSECDQPKPSPDAYLEALQALQVSHKHAFVF